MSLYGVWGPRSICEVKCMRGDWGLWTSLFFAVGNFLLSRTTSQGPTTDWTSLVHPPPPSPLPSPYFLSLPVELLLVSSPAGRSFFEKTTQARTRPTPHSQKLRSLTHPNRRYSSTFVSIPTSVLQVSSSLSANFLLSTSVRGESSIRPLNLSPYLLLAPLSLT